MGDMQIVVSAAAASNKKVVEAQYVEMVVPLYSYGCERKIKSSLAHLKGIYSVNVDYNEQKVTVWGICNKYDVLSTVKKKRKEARFWNHHEQQHEQDDEDHNYLINTTITTTNNASTKEEEEEQAGTQKSSFSRKKSAALILARSLSWKSLKKVFVRSYSF